jgi:hypothetical protein
MRRDARASLTDRETPGRKWAFPQAGLPRRVAVSANDPFLKRIGRPQDESAQVNVVPHGSKRRTLQQPLESWSIRCRRLFQHIHSPKSGHLPGRRSRRLGQIPDIRPRPSSANPNAAATNCVRANLLRLCDGKPSISGCGARRTDSLAVEVHLKDTSAIAK